MDQLSELGDFSMLFSGPWDPWGPGGPCATTLTSAHAQLSHLVSVEIIPACGKSFMKTEVSDRVSDSTFCIFFGISRGLIFESEKFLDVLGFLEC